MDVAGMIGVQDRAALNHKPIPLGQISHLMSKALLAMVIERDVIPLIAGARPASSQPNWEPMIAELTALTFAADATAAPRYVAGLLAKGHRAQDLCLHLLTPVARKLGQGWVDDECDFVDVTIGVWRLHDAMRLLTPQLRGARRRNASRRVLLAPLPGEQHTFGIAMVAEFFHRAGWKTWHGTVETEAELAAFLSREHVDVLGFSLASDDFLEPAREQIRKVRQASLNPHLIVMVGGSCFHGKPERALWVGADGTADDAPQTVAKAERLLACALQESGREPMSAIDNGPGE